MKELKEKLNHTQC